MKLLCAYRSCYAYLAAAIQVYQEGLDTTFVGRDFCEAMPLHKQRRSITIIARPDGANGLGRSPRKIHVEQCAVEIALEQSRITHRNHLNPGVCYYFFSLEHRFATRPGESLRA